MTERTPKGDAAPNEQDAVVHALRRGLEQERLAEPLEPQAAAELIRAALDTAALNNAAPNNAAPNNAAPNAAPLDTAALNNAAPKAAPLDAAKKGSAPVRRLRPRWPLAIGVAALTLTAGVAAASLYLYVSRPASELSPPIPPPQVTQNTPVLDSARPAQPAAPDVPDAAIADAATTDTFESTSEAAPPKARPVRPGALRSTPRDLLAEASRLRRAGKFAEAERRYEQLLREAPASSSAYVARVALARLRLGRNPQGAINLLQAAHRQSPSGALEPEILGTMARAYRSLGNPSAESRTLRQLVRAHPSTAAARAAKKRLETLAAP